MDIAPSLYGETVADFFDQHLARSDTASTVEFLASLLPANGSALEVGIGTGRVSLPLVEQGFEVWGVDASPRMIANLRKKPGGERIPVLEGDFVTRALPDRFFDVVFILDWTFNGLGTQESQIEFLRRAKRLLAPDGHVVVHLNLPPLDSIHRTRVSFAVDRPDGVLHAVRLSHSPLSQTLTGQASWMLPGGSRFDLPVTTRYCWPSELALMANVVGLSSPQLHGGWDRTEINLQANEAVAVFTSSAS